MATRSFLVNEDVSTALQLLRGPQIAKLAESVQVKRSACSLWLEGKLLERLNQCGDFLTLDPILLGSWSRHELTPKSDIDLLFVGPEASVHEFVRKAMLAGLKLRARTPEDMQDWSVGVEPFDILALHSARALTPRGQELLNQQRTLAHRQRRQILAKIRKERSERHHRQDSISNFLEPNLKFGSGGLRDIEQGLAILALFPEKFAEESAYPFEVLRGIKEELLYLRSLLHVQGSNDIFSAHDQLEVAEFLGDREAIGPLMKHLQSELERASFYADWAVAFAHLAVRKMPRAELKSLESAVQQLKAKPTLDLQYRIRLNVDSLAKSLSGEERGRILHQALFADYPDSHYVSLQRSRVLEVLLPDLKKLRGHSQHDHYHRYTADAHLVQSLREVQRAKTAKRSLGIISKLTKDLTAQEWWTLKLTALFHDLAKGRKGDHATEGAKLVDRYFVEWGLSESLREDVHWLVENHLLMSTAAFRQNPQAQTTWTRLFERGVQGRRLILLALFTAIDIRATNPEAWTDWKSKLLMALVDNLQSPQAQSFQKHLKYAGATRRKATYEWLLKLDPMLLENLSPKILIEDLIGAADSKIDLPIKVLRVKGRLWVRFHRKVDQTGLFLNFVKRLYSLGLNVQTASISTLENVGVYDWFCLKSDKSTRQISLWLSAERLSTFEIPKVQLQSVGLMSQDTDEWVISFKGRDQRGLLLAAAQSLVEENLSLRWARVHTWGQQIEDIFGVQPSGQVESKINRLHERFIE